MPLPFIVCAAVTIFSACMSYGFSQFAVMRAKSEEAKTASLYARGRSMALLIPSGIVLTNHSQIGLEYMAIAMSIAQIYDGIVGLEIKNTLKTVGPFGIAAVNLAAVAWMMGFHLPGE